MKATVQEKFQSSHLLPPYHLIQDLHHHQTLLQKMKELLLERKKIQNSKPVLIFLMMLKRDSKASQERCVSLIQLKINKLSIFKDLIEMVCFLQRTVESQGKKVADLEDYIDGMVLRVMEKAPVILDTNLKYYCSLYKQH